MGVQVVYLRLSIFSAPCTGYICVVHKSLTRALPQNWCCDTPRRCSPGSRHKPVLLPIPAHFDLARLFFLLPVSRLPTPLTSEGSIYLVTGALVYLQVEALTEPQLHS